MSTSYDVIIIGAGASGLMAAWELVQAGRSTAVIEARDRIGGRIQTLHEPGFELAVETGAEFVHGKLKLTRMLLKRSGIDQFKVNGDIWQKADGRLDEQKDFIEDYSKLEKKFKELDSDLPVAAFIDKYLKEDEFEDLRFSLKNYVEGYYAADTKKASTFALRDELKESSSKQYRIENGYAGIIDFLFERSKEKNAKFFLSSPVTKITWTRNKVKVHCNGTSFQSKKLLITVPVGILQEEKIKFSPAITQKTRAAKKLGYGPVIKTILQFDEPFWENKDYTQNRNLRKMGFLFSEETIPTWWTTLPKKSAMLTGWSGGPHAQKLKNIEKQKIIETALLSLSNIFNMDQMQLTEKLINWHVADWPSDPFGCNGYSYQVVNGAELQNIVKEPVEDTLYFAGEGLFAGSEIGTVEAALQTGQEASYQIIAGF